MGMTKNTPLTFRCNSQTVIQEPGNLIGLALVGVSNVPAIYFNGGSFVAGAGIDRAFSFTGKCGTIRLDSLAIAVLSNKGYAVTGTRISFSQFILNGLSIKSNGNGVWAGSGGGYATKGKSLFLCKSSIL